MILAILAFIWGYRKGRDSGRNAALWSAICGFTFLGIQVVVSLGLGIIIGLGIALWGWSEDLLDKYSMLISIVSVIPAGLVLWLIIRYLDRVPAEPVASLPPPPPTFGQN